MKQSIFGKIINGVFSFRNGEEEKWTDIFSGKLSDSDNIKITFEKTTEKNYECTKMRRYYRGVPVRILAWEMGYTNEEMHQIFINNFLSYEKAGRKGTKRRFQNSTAHGKITTKEFSEFLEKIWELGRKMNCKIPTTEEIENNPNILEELYPEVFRKNISVSQMKKLLEF